MTVKGVHGIIKGWEPLSYADVSVPVCTSAWPPLRPVSVWPPLYGPLFFLLAWRWRTNRQSCRPLISKLSTSQWTARPGGSEWQDIKWLLDTWPRSNASLERTEETRSKRWRTSYSLFKPAMSNPRPSGRMQPSRRFYAAQLRFSLWKKSLTYWQPVLILITLNVTFLMQVVLSAIFSRLLPLQLDSNAFSILA